MGKLRLRSNQINEAVSFYRQAISLNPESTEAMLNIGVFYANNNQLDKALEIWRKALSIDPDNRQIKENIYKAKELLRAVK